MKQIDVSIVNQITVIKMFSWFTTKNKPIIIIIIIIIIIVELQRYENSGPLTLLPQTTQIKICL